MTFSTSPSIFIIGCGHLGSLFASECSEKGYSVTILDQKNNAFRKLSPSFNGWNIVGDGTDYSLLQSYGIASASHIYLLTQDDPTNIMMAKLLHHRLPQAKIVVRLYDPHLRLLLNEQDIQTFCPVEWGVTRLSQVLHETEVIS